MTGFGAAALEAVGWRFQAEVRSVNHRHLLVKVRLGSEFAAFEGDVESVVRGKLERGSISVHVEAVAPRAAEEAEIDTELARRYQKRIARLARELELDGTLSLATLLSLPGVVAGETRRPAELERLRRAVLRVTEQALEALLRMRETEGRAIGTELARHARATRALLARIEKRMPEVLRGHQRNLKQRVEELLGAATPLQPSDLAREIAVLADRLDVSEELARVASHLDQLDGLLARGGGVGRQLDFLVQELFRELNTIGSKCSDARVAHWVIDAKAHAERLREQLQNLE